MPGSMTSSLVVVVVFRLVSLVQVLGVLVVSGGAMAVLARLLVGSYVLWRKECSIRGMAWDLNV